MVLHSSTPVKTAITNVRVFDSEKLLPLGTVFINGGLSGLIDAHTHPQFVDHLEAFASYGITTAIAAIPGLPDVRFSGLSANVPNSTHAMMLGLRPNETITSPSDAPRFVAKQYAAGAAFIKLVAKDLGLPILSQATMDALVVLAHAHGLRIVGHAADYAAVDRVLAAGVDQSHHVPADLPLNSHCVPTPRRQRSIVSVPTLSIFQQLATGGKPDGAPGFAMAKANAALLHAAGVPILAGTDSNNGVGPFALAYGSSLHTELELLVQAGLSTVEALRVVLAARLVMSLAARHNLLFDRGLVAPGMRADLLLISGDPIANISVTRNIEKVWIKGVEYANVMTK
ncbi:hypothetical protein B0H19DRAFT_1279622 [Mycena capillaripes]|nr:hypothetical protein B0H19DRAFT_1279622 [Mycena capillaripes]